MDHIEKIRSNFPFLKTGLKYFNHAAISPIPDPVKKQIDAFLKIRSETNIEPYFDTLQEAIGAKIKLAELLNVDSDNLAWSSNVSDSLNILAQGLPWKSGDEIIINDIEFPSNVYPFLNLQKCGVKVAFAKSANGKVDLSEIEKLVTANTKLISISMVQFLSGYRADLESIGKFCKDKGIIFCVDGIQGVGAVRLNVKESMIDFFTGGTHKWLMGLQGLGYFYISDELFEKVDVKFVGWTSVKNPWKLIDYNLDLLQNAGKYETGTLPRIAIIALNSSLSFFHEIGSAFIENRILDNSVYLFRKLFDLGCDTVLKNVNRQNMSGIVSIKLKNSEMILQKLEEKRIICSLREGILRISPHFYNTRYELDLLVSEIEENVSN